MKKVTKFISVVLAIVMVVGVLPLSGIITDSSFNTSVEVGAVSITDSGTKGFEQLRKLLEDTTTTKIKLEKTIEYQTDWGGGTPFKPIKITSYKELDLNGHSIVVDNVTNASRNKITSSIYYSKETIAENSNCALFEIDDNSSGDSVGKLIVLNTGAKTDQYSPLSDGSVTIQHTGFPVGDPGDIYSKHYRDYCIRDVFNVINGTLVFDGDFSVVAGQTKEQNYGSLSDKIENLVSSTIGLALDLSSTVATCCASGTGKKSSTSEATTDPSTPASTNPASSNPDSSEPASSNPDSSEPDSSNPAAADELQDAPSETATAEVTTLAPAQAPVIAEEEIVVEEECAPAAKLDAAPTGDSSSGGGQQSGGGQSSASGQQQASAGGNTIASALSGLAKSTSIGNFTSALFDIIKSLDSCYQIIWGSCVNVGSGATFICNKGKLYGYGQNDVERDAVVTAAAGSNVQINDGEFYGKAGADIFHVDVNSNTSIKKGIFECSYISQLRLTDQDNKSVTYPGTIGATGITLNMFNENLISDGRMMIKAKVLPKTSLAEERRNLAALDEGANKSAATKIISQANLVKSQALMKNKTTGKWELDDTVDLPLSSWIEVCPSYGLTSGCTDSLYLTTDDGITGTVEVNKYGTKAVDKVIQVWGTDYYNNCLIGADSEIEFGTSRTIYGYVTVHEVNPITGEAGNLVYDNYYAGKVQSFNLKYMNLQAGKTYKFTYQRTDKLTYSDNKYNCDQASTEMIIRVKNGVNPYVEKLDFKSTPLVAGKTVEVALSGVDFNETYKGAKVFNCSFEWYSAGNKVATTTTNSYKFTSGGSNVYCKVTITPTATGKQKYPNFKSLTVQTDTATVYTSFTKPVIRTQPQNSTYDSFFGSFEVYTDVIIDTDKTAVGYKWYYKKGESGSWATVDGSSLQATDSDGKISRLKNYVSENSLATYANDYHTSGGTSTYSKNDSMFNYYDLGYYQIRLDFKGIEKNTPYYFKCELTNAYGTVTTNEVRVQYNDNTCISGVNLLNPNNIYEDLGFSYDNSTNTVSLEDFDGTIDMGKITFAYNNEESNANSGAIFSSSGENLTVKIEGDNKITIGDKSVSGTEGFAEYFLYSSGNVTFCGDGNLTVVFNNYCDDITLLRAKTLTFKNTGKISFVFEDNINHTDNGYYHYIVPVAADTVTMTPETGSLECKITRNNKSTAKMKIVDCFVKSDNSNYYAKVDATVFEQISNTYRSKVSGTMANGSKFVYLYGSSQSNATKVTGSATDVNKSLYSKCNICDYFSIGVMNSQELKLDNGCSHVAAEPVQEKVVEATCTTAGSHEDVVYCTKCKIEISRTKVTKEAAHTWDEGKVTKAATFTAAGKAVYTCAVCKATETAIIPALSKTTENSFIIYVVPDTKASVVDSSSKITKNGKSVADSTKLATGMTVETLDGKKMTVVVPGDVTCDGSVTTSDARKSLRRVIGLETYSTTSAQYKAGQVDSSAKFTINDARTLLRGALNKEKPTDWYTNIK